MASFYLFLFNIFLCVFASSLNSREKRNIMCQELSQSLLEKVLGGAFNPRYMSITPPLGNDEVYNEEINYKRDTGAVPSFYVDGDYFQEFGDDPAWYYDSHRTIMLMEGPHRMKREVKTIRQWECESKIIWNDLGPDYFPRYIRNVHCTATDCWYGMYNCKPRSFTIKLLKRRKGKCVESVPRLAVGPIELRNDLMELWVWEERAVNFCCDCTLDN